MCQPAPGDGRERDNPEEDQGPSQGRGWFPFCFFPSKSFLIFLIVLSYTLGAHLLWPQRQAGGEAVRLPDGRHGG